MNLLEFIDAYRYKEFAYGINDCCLFVADYVHAVSGVDHAESWRGTYNDARGARDIIGTNGGYEKIFDDALPGCRVDPLTTVDGDIVLYNLDNRVTAGIRIGHWCATPAKTGLSLVPCNVVFAAWRLK